MAHGNLVRQRIEKLQKLRDLGVEPYAYSFDPDRTAQDVQDQAEDLIQSGETVRLAGRLMLKRRHGKAGFGHIQDRTGRLQLYFRLDHLGEGPYEIYKLADAGDLLGAGGPIFRTKTGEVTLEVRELALLSKSIQPMPEKWHGLRDVELRYRKRHLDLIMNPEVQKTFQARAAVIRTAREVLDQSGFLEVETPILQPLYGGATARPFVTHHNKLDMPLYLRIADELYLKRLIVGGMERVYEIGKDFRNEGMDRSHNPEFTMLECYQAYADYEDMMALFEELVSRCALAVHDSLRVEWQGQEINLEPPYPRRPMLELIQEHAGIDLAGLDEDALRGEYRRIAPEDGKRAGLNRGQMIDGIFKRTVEPKLIQPIFVTDHPVEISPLAKEHRSQPGLVERFEPFILGWEMGNAFSELNDPLEQRRRFEEQRELLRAGDEEAHPLDEDFLEAVECGLPPTGGLGLGMDRLIMLLTDSSSIQDVILFPQMRPR